MLVETAAVRSVYLGLLLLVLAAGLLCSAVPVNHAKQLIYCNPGNHAQQLIQRREIRLMEQDDQFDKLCCNSSHWVIDEKKGTLRILFQPPKREHMKHLTLQKWQSGRWSTYAEEWYIFEDFEDQNQCGYHDFEYISSGRYRLKECYSKSKERTINTMFNESTLNCSSGGHIINSKYVPGSRDKITMEIIFTYELPRKMDRIYTLKDSNNTVIKTWAIKARKEDSENLMCETNDNGVKYKPVLDNFDEQVFEIAGLYPSYYNLEVEVFGPLSVKQTKLGVCVKKIQFSITELYLNSSELSSARSGHPVTQQEDLPVMVMIGLAAIAVFGSLGFVIYKLITRGPPPDERKTGNYTEQQDLTSKRVLLLYARDCPQFSDLMVTFRDLLKENNFEVYDCYDPAHSRTVDHRGPTLWMRCLVEDNSVRVVVVSTKCAQLQQVALMSGGSITYKQPDYLDRLFIYGLSNAMAIHTNTYRKIYSIVLEGFTQKEDTLNILSDRIYSLPSHLVELFRDLRYNSEPPEETETLKQQITTLKEKLDVLVRYTKIEEDYLYRTVLTY